MQYYLDQRKQICPIPVVKAKQQLEQCALGDIVTVIVDNEIAVTNLRKMALDAGMAVSVDATQVDAIAVEIIVGTKVDQSRTDSHIELGQTNLLLLASETIGKGDETLGTMLMRGYLYALSQQPNVPKTIVLLNGGVKLAVADSLVIPELQNLIKREVDLIVCGTCVNYYGIEKDLVVGRIANMYTIATAMEVAGKVTTLL